MVAPKAGSVVLVPFPFSDLSQAKLRPAVVLADAGRDDLILCQVTSNRYADATAVELRDDSFTEGGLRRVSYARPGKLFTAGSQLFVGEVGRLDAKKLEEIVGAVVRLLEQGSREARGEKGGLTPR